MPRNSQTEMLIRWWGQAIAEGIHPQDALILKHKDEFATNGMTPVPYLGDLRRARLVIVMLNPGLEEDARVRKADETHEKTHLTAALRQEPGIGFWPLQVHEMSAINPGGPGSRRYWRSTFKSYVASKTAEDPESVYAEIGRNICCVQLLPYHSKQAPNKRLGTSLKSVQLMTEWIKEEIQLA